MMKSFFKKLAFVMALAMVVTLAAPAAQSASAAEAMYLAYQAGGKVTELNMRVGDAEDLCFKKAPANWATLDKKWSSNNEAVAIVDKNGVVTALADGTATITFALSDGTAASVKVTVGDIKPYDVTLGNADNKAMTELTLEVGTAFDLNFYGVKDWVSSKYSVVWISDLPEIAKVDQKGNVAAVSAGTATVTAAIVNNKTGVTMNVTPVVVTVPAEVVVPEFTAEQLNTVAVALTFGENVDLSEVIAEDFEVTAIDEMFEYTLFANTATVDKNVVTLTFVEGILTDGAVLKIGYKGAEETLVASNGEVVKAVVSYGMTDKYAGDAYVYTELDPDYVLLSYKLYDKNDIDVTANYEENKDYSIEWALTSGSDYASEPEEGDNGWQMSFDEKGTADVKLMVTFTNEDGEDRTVESLPVRIAAKNRPTIAFSKVETGLVDMTGTKDNKLAVVDSFNNPEGSIWSDDLYALTIQKGKTAYYGARLVDNRGKELISTQLEFDAIDYQDNDKSTLFAEGDTMYKEYGYFVYESSNEDVLDIDANTGLVTAVEVGNATILVSFVKYSEDGEEMDPVKVASTRVAVTTDYPEPYARTYEFIADSRTVTSTGASMNTNAYVIFYDQYGHVYTGFTVDQLNKASKVTVPSTYATGATLQFVKTGADETAKNSETGNKKAYRIALSGDDLKAWYNDTIKDNGYAVLKFTLEFDKDIDENFSKITTKNDKLSVKVYNVDKYYTELTKFFNGEHLDAAETAYTKWNYDVSGAASVNAYVDKRTEFDAKKENGYPQPSKEVKVALNSAAGLKLMDLPQEYFIPLTEKVDVINKRAEADRGLVEGAIYYQLSYPSKADNYEVTTGSALLDKNGNIIDGVLAKFTFNDTFDVDFTDEIELATPGNYTVTLYQVNSKNQLVKLSQGQGTVNIAVSDTTPAVKAEGFIKTNVSEEEITKEDVAKVLPTMYNFTWDGELLYNAETETFSENFAIDSVKCDDDHEDKIVVTEITFKLGYFNNCAKITDSTDDNFGGVKNNADDLYQYVTLKKRITIKFDK